MRLRESKLSAKKLKLIKQEDFIEFYTNSGFARGEYFYCPVTFWLSTKFFGSMFWLGNYNSIWKDTHGHKRHFETPEWIKGILFPLWRQRIMNGGKITPEEIIKVSRDHW